MVILLLAMLAQTADLATYRADNEVWFVTLSLGALAPVLKVALIVYLAWLALVLPRVIKRRVFLLALVAGTVGFVSNVA